MSKSKKKSEKPLYDENGHWADEKRMVIGAIRRLFRQSPQFKEVSEASRVEVPRYNKDGNLSKKPYVKKTCEVCSGLFSSTNIAIDHVDPMVPLHLTDDDLTYEEIVRKIICDRSNLQRICNPKKGIKNKPKFLEFCHQKKSHAESFVRNKWKQHFLEKGIVSRAGKDTEYHFFGKQFEEKWKEEYNEHLRLLLEEVEAKEKRKLERLAKRNKSK